MGVKKYVKKLVFVEAIEVTNESMLDCYKFLGDKVDLTCATDGTFINIKTKFGLARASIGDFIVKGANTGFLPCEPDIFWKTYREA